MWVPQHAPCWTIFRVVTVWTISVVRVQQDRVVDPGGALEVLKPVGCDNVQGLRYLRYEDMDRLGLPIIQQRILWGSGPLGYQSLKCAPSALWTG